MKRRHFHTFDALRFFAYFKVFLLHLPLYSFPVFSFIKGGGGIGVQFFFVLSGFLITYIILHEKIHTGRLNLKNFYIRRILRIWPLYFLMVGFSFAAPIIIRWLNVTHSDEGYEPRWYWSVFFVENYRMILENNHPNISPLTVMWSLCIEEHFYIVWGLLLFFVPVKHFPKIVIVCLITAVVSRVVFVLNDWQTVDLFTNIDLFAFGGLLGYYLNTKPETAEKILHFPRRYKLLFILFMITAVGLQHHIFSNKTGEVISPLIFGGLFTLLLAVFIPEKSRLKIPDRSFLSKWGKISYGLYLYHPIVINALIQVFAMLKWQRDDPVFAIIFSITAFFLTVFISHLSYILFEKPFLRLKKYFYRKD